MSTPMNQDWIEQRRAAARRTAWILAAVAFAIFVAFLLRGMLAS